MDNLGATNTWLAVLTVVSVLEFLLMVAAGVCAYRMYHRVMTVVEDVERNHIAPLRARADEVLDEVEVMVAKLRQAQESVGGALTNLAGLGALLAGSLTVRWPRGGIIQGVRVAVAALGRANSGKRPGLITMSRQ